MSPRQPAAETRPRARRTVRSRPVISRVHSFILEGIDAVPCEIEADYRESDDPRTMIVGLPDASVRESQQRVRAAIRNSGYWFPRGRLTLNLAPADVRKEGPVYDLPIALAVLSTGTTITGNPPEETPRLEDYFVAGELALDGRVRAVRGAVSLAILARMRQRRGVIVPRDNAAEAAVVDGVDVRGVETLAQVIAMLNGKEAVAPHATIDVEALVAATEPEIDFGDVRGQEAAKRALTIAAAGAHNVLMIGPAGTGKTMMARALPGVLPPLSRDEALEVTRIYSSAGKLARNGPLCTRRPVRSPHHTASGPAIVGGGTVPRPGDVSLAHRGVLFLDEMAEFSRHVLETLRQPLEEGWVTVARTHGSVRFPARFMLVGAVNPTPKGSAGADEASRRAMEKYLGRLSGPLIDRIDLHVEVPAVHYRQLTSGRRGTDSAEIRKRVLEARRRQSERQGAALPNAELSGRLLDRHAPLDEPGRALLGQAMSELGLSARAYDKVRRVARTIADLESSERVEVHHAAEAIQYRLLDRMT